ncbi:hypothetical protein HYH03_003508 [Edaphochlamys debaryana]|uniref:BRO1 domain-containing protein n=1 Tax=Edaphochlamys debaryana TaxID=47281 RepID=A0A835YJF0_9CHLO|nr:hypothetical protein HYH03_003508 [Edaphochlamys debaryana]|eukprot:KAG2498769.1 hypothetical protein HYH03_003508 [Edaphochlamys debaryana]
MAGTDVLDYRAPLQGLATKPYDYAGALTGKGGAPPALVATLEASVRPDFLAELSFRRGAMSAWLGTEAAAGASGLGTVPDGVLEGLAALASGLHGLLATVAAPTVAPPAGPAGAGHGGGGPGGPPPPPPPAAAAAFTAAAALTAGSVRSEWTSALSSKPQRMLRLDNLSQELAMVYTAYAAALRQSAHGRVAEAAATAAAAAAGAAATAPPAGPDGGGGSPTAAAAAEAAPADGDGAAAAVKAVLTAAVAALRRAAGVYGFLADKMLPELAGIMAGIDRPLELLLPSARALRALCLAEAQALTAAAAAARGMSAGTQRALHGGCVTLLAEAEEAARQLSAAAPSGLPAADRLPRLLGTSGALHRGRCFLLLAQERHRAMELGDAEACLEECNRLLDAASKRLDRSDPPSWAAAVAAQRAAVAALLAPVQKDRLGVTYQPLPKEMPDALASAAVKVSPDAFEPAPAFPPAPVIDPNNKQGGCCIM